MFILYGLLLGLVAGLVAGGSLARLGSLRLHWVGLAIGGFLVQLVLFSSPVTDRVGALGPPIYVGSTLVVLIFVLRNIRVPGLALIAIGAVSNLAAILANGGYMPASPSALRSLGKTDPTTYSNSVELASPALAPLTDIFAMPAFLPFANVFSIGDVLIGAGVAIALAVAMRGTGDPEVAGQR